MLGGISYAALLHLRWSEFQAVVNLDSGLRSKIFFTILLRPWPHGNSIDFTLKNLRDMAGNNHYGLDLDRSAIGKGRTAEIKGWFEELFDAANGCESYYEFLAKETGAVPVLQFRNGKVVDIASQLRRVEKLDRGLIVRLTQGNWTSLGEFIDQLNVDDTLFIVDGGWAIDPLQQEVWMSHCIKLIAGADETAEIVCMASSFPDRFVDISYKDDFDIREQTLCDRLRRQHNSANIVYGDWGSTRPEAKGGGNAPARIDIAQAVKWTCFRATDTEQGFSAVAQRAVRDKVYQTAPDCWGKYQIAKSVAKETAAIRSFQSVAAARINLHLHIQAGQGQIATGTEVEFED